MTHYGMTHKGMNHFFSIPVIEEKSENDSLPSTPVTEFSLVGSPDKLNHSDSTGTGHDDSCDDSSDIYETPDSFDSGHPHSPSRNIPEDDIDKDYIKSL